MFKERTARAQARMADLGIDVLLLSVGPDLPYLSGYEAMPLERLTMYVLPRNGYSSLLVPRLEAARVIDDPAEVFTLVMWDEEEDPIERVAALVGDAQVAAIGDRTWSRFLLLLQARLPQVRFRPASEVTGPLRAVKDAAEIATLRRASTAADRVAAQLQGGEIALVGRTEADVSKDLGRRLIAEGHYKVNFAIVGSAENGASPHHDASQRVIEAGDVIVCDFGGTMRGEDGVGYCSDITRTVVAGGVEPPAVVRDAYAVLHDAQQAAVAAATVGTSCAGVDAVARDLITAAGWGDRFIHRTGHGIGIEEHEDPYIVATNRDALVAGNAFSVEPGIYVPNEWGMRLEDIVLATESGPESLNTADHSLVVVDT